MPNPKSACSPGYYSAAPSGQLSWAGEDGQHSFARKPRSDNGPHGATRSSDQLHQIVSELTPANRAASRGARLRLAGEVHQLAAAERAALAHELLAVDRPETDPR